MFLTVRHELVETREVDARGVSGGPVTRRGLRRRRAARGRATFAIFRAAVKRYFDPEITLKNR
jgi:hypothetical protein